MELQQPEVQGPDMRHGDQGDEDVETDVDAPRCTQETAPGLGSGTTRGPSSTA